MLFGGSLDVTREDWQNSIAHGGGHGGSTNVSTVQTSGCALIE
jgi:hypothetical protein